MYTWQCFNPFKWYPFSLSILHYVFIYLLSIHCKRRKIRGKRKRGREVEREGGKGVRACMLCRAWEHSMWRDPLCQVTSHVAVSAFIRLPEVWELVYSLCCCYWWWSAEHWGREWSLLLICRGFSTALFMSVLKALSNFSLTNSHIIMFVTYSGSLHNALHSSSNNNWSTP